MLLPAAFHPGLYFDHSQLVAGHWVGLISGHWMHADAPHLAWNVAALAVLGALIELRSRRLLLWSILVGMGSVDLLLLSPLSELQRYCGLLGLLNTLLGVVLCLLWQSSRSRLVMAVGLACFLKIVFEIGSGQSVFTDISWPPFALAHLAGALATPIALLLGHRDTRAANQSTRMTGKHYGRMESSA